MRYLIFILFLFSCKNPPEFYYSQGRTDSMRTNYYEAIEHLTKAIKMKPKYIEAYSERANAYMQIDSMEKAIQDYDSLLSFTKNNYQKQGELHYLKGNAFYLLVQDSLACKEWRIAKELNCYGAWNKIRNNCK